MLQSLLGNSKEGHKSSQHLPQKPLTKEQQLKEKVSGFFRQMEKRVHTFLEENDVSEERLETIQDSLLSVLSESEASFNEPEEESSDSEEEVQCSGEEQEEEDESREPLGELNQKE